MSIKVEISGTVTDQFEAPLSDVVVLIEKGPGDFNDLAALTDEQGKFSFKDLSPGNYSLLFNGEGFQENRQNVEAKSNSTQVRVSLDPE